MPKRTIPELLRELNENFIEVKKDLVEIFKTRSNQLFWCGVHSAIIAFVDGAFSQYKTIYSI